MDSRNIMKNIRPIQIDGPIAYIPLTKGYTAIIDAEDVSLVKHWNWSAKESGKTVYARRASPRVQGKQCPMIPLHRVVGNIPRGLLCDHINGNGLDNRKCNLRISDASENQCNRGAQANSQSGIKGVFFRKSTGKWMVSIKKRQTRKILGPFLSKDDAFKEMLVASKELHSEFSFF